MRVTTLARYISVHYGTQVAFAQAMGLWARMPSYWVCDNWVVLGGRLYSPRRRVPVLPEQPLGDFQAMPLLDYILEHHSHPAEFARRMGVKSQHVSYWVACQWIVVGSRLYSPRRRVPALQATNQEEVTA